MTSSPDATWQPSLFAGQRDVGIDRGFSGLVRVQLDPTSWVDHVPGWLAGADKVFEDVLTSRAWGQRTRRMYDKEVLEPRLTAPWNAYSGDTLEPPILEEIRHVLSERYQRTFDSVGFNLYRDGRDSVAWHADRIPKEVEVPIVALVSLGEPRKFQLRPKGGRIAHTFLLGDGDLLVTGGDTQRTWEHAVPKVKEAGPRISIAFRHDMRRSKEYPAGEAKTERPRPARARTAGGSAGHKDLLTRYLREMFDEGRPEAAERFLSPDYRRHISGAPEPIDRDGQVRRAAGFLQAFGDVTVTIEDAVAEGDLVAVRATMRAKHRGEFGGIAPTGREVTVPLLDLYRIEGGRIAEQWSGPDVHRVVETQLAQPG